MSKLSTCLWFDTEAEEAANFYVSVFKDGKIGAISRYGEEGHDVHGKPAGSVLTAQFEVNGMKFTALNGGPQFKFTEAVSFVVTCKDQDEIDYYWGELTEGGGAESMCGWLKDKYGLSWQVIPEALPELLGGSDQAKSQRAMKAMFGMRKLVIADLEKAREAA